MAGGTTKGKRFSQKTCVDKDKLYYKPEYSGSIDVSDIKVYNQLKKMATYWLHKFSLDFDYINDVILYIVEKSVLYNAEKLNGGNSFSYYNVIARNYCLYLKKNENMFVGFDDVDNSDCSEKSDYVGDYINYVSNNDNIDLYNCFLDFFKASIDDFIEEFSKRYLIDYNISKNIFYYCVRLLDERVIVIGTKHFIYLLYEEKFDRRVVKKFILFLKEKYLYFKKYLYNY